MTLWARRLLIATVVAYVIAALVPGLAQRLALVPVLLPLRPWTIVTYMFVHAGFVHLLFNMIGLFFFGPRLEARLGSRDFLLLYFLSGMGGAVLFILSLYLTSSSIIGVALVGASGAVFGILIGFARYWPTEPIYIYGILPVQARWLVVLLTVFSLYAGFSGAGGRVAHFAHLGGFAVGYLFLKLRERRLGAAKRKWVSATQPSKTVTGHDQSRWDRIPMDGLHELNRREVERIREKIRQSGVQSLQPDERAFMDRMSRT